MIKLQSIYNFKSLVWECKWYLSLAKIWTVIGVFLPKSVLSQMFDMIAHGDHRPGPPNIIDQIISRQIFYFINNCSQSD